MVLPTAASLMIVSTQLALVLFCASGMRHSIVTHEVGVEQQGTIRAIGSNSSQRKIASLQEPCECKVSHSKKQLKLWLTLAAETMDDCCENYGPLFGLPVGTVCPSSIKDITTAVDTGTKKMGGGKSGTDLILAGDYVIKVISGTEARQQNLLLQNLKKHPLTGGEVSLLVPTCRLIPVALRGKTKLHYVLVSPNVHLKVPGNRPKQYQMLGVGFERVYDLKGNWGWRNRNEKNPQKSPKKDANFRNQFPKGLKLTKACFPGQNTVQEEKGTPSPLFTQLKKDTDRLAKLGLMDYSILLHLVQVPKGVSELWWKANVRKNKAMFAATYDSKHYVMTLGIIDMLMHEGSRGAGNVFMNGVTLSACSPKDLDPIPARPYRVRFMRMVGWQDPEVNKVEKGKKTCGACLSTRRRYAYFSSPYQRAKSSSRLGRKKACEWGTAFELDGLPK